MSSGDSVAAAIFYSALVLGVSGMVLAARSRIERDRTDRRGLVIAGVAMLAICLSVAFYALGPRRVLPF